MRTPSVRLLLLLAAGLLLLLPHGSAAQRAKPVFIATGVQGRTYHDVYGVNLKALLPGFRVEFQETNGSLDNLDRLR